MNGALRVVVENEKNNNSKQGYAKMTRYLYTPYEERILRTLIEAHRPLTTQQISDYSGISYNTTRKILKNLNMRKVIKMESQSNKILWTMI